MQREAKHRLLGSTENEVTFARRRHFVRGTAGKLGDGAGHADHPCASFGREGGGSEIADLLDRPGQHADSHRKEREPARQSDPDLAVPRFVQRRPARDLVTGPAAAKTPTAGRVERADADARRMPKGAVLNGVFHALNLVIGAPGREPSNPICRGNAKVPPPWAAGARAFGRI
jgi:hypothetical protein